MRWELSGRGPRTGGRCWGVGTAQDGRAGMSTLGGDACTRREPASRTPHRACLPRELLPQVHYHENVPHGTAIHRADGLVGCGGLVCRGCYTRGGHPPARARHPVGCHALPSRLHGPLPAQHDLFLVRQNLSLVRQHTFRPPQLTHPTTHASCHPPANPLAPTRSP